MTYSRRTSRVAASAMVLTTPVIAFWLIGDRSASDDPAQNDYLVRWTIDHTSLLVVGVLATLIFLAAATHLYLHRGATPDRAAAQLVALLMVAGVLLAGGLRVVTAGVNGANIGGAAFLTLGLPMLAALVVFAVVRHRRAGAPVTPANGRRP